MQISTAVRGFSPALAWYHLHLWGGRGVPETVPALGSRSDVLLDVCCCFPFGRKHPVAALQKSYGAGLTGEAGISNSHFFKVFFLNFSHPDRAFVLALSLSPSSLSIPFQSSLLPCYSLSLALKQTEYLSPTFKNAHSSFFQPLADMQSRGVIKPLWYLQK